MQHSTQVLSEALNKLINAYEDLQLQNKKLNDKINELEEENALMQETIDNLSSTTDKQSQDISSMLGKIESLLSVGDNIFSNDKQSSNTQVTSSTDDQTEEEISQLLLEENNEVSGDSDEEISTAKIDLQRMESLLSGFGNR
ncbi:hypothetical protein [Arcobacter sp. FWKO B]|uniref:hypothetical protein n=1 Tax=Arcobacter sp. FWKO B TaxID=2593672 RepID=UPI0018A5F2A3|nr:hypothetical protein [Arcobacter sp. FWKO B]QOG11375.1 hypothetical protein FWKOB_01095 [Arcobacter sp. FWKO B]